MIQRGININVCLTQMKLQKLIYFAHGWSLALYDEPLVDKIWGVFGKYNGTQLSAMTHVEGSPWRNIYYANPSGRDMIIPNSEIKTYFKGLMS